MQKFCSINLTETELAEIKITTANLSTELKSKLKFFLNVFFFFLNYINFFFLECEANFQRIGQEEKELKVAEENLKKELEGKILQPQMIWKL
jgi:hypothetical protein